MDTESAMVDYYAQRAQEYERIYDKPERQDDLRNLKDSVGNTLAGRNVLEVACGTGYWTAVAASAAASITAPSERVTFTATSSPNRLGSANSSETITTPATSKFFHSGYLFIGRALQAFLIVSLGTTAAIE